MVENPLPNADFFLQTVCGLSVVDGDWDELKKYNMTELYNQAAGITTVGQKKQQQQQQQHQKQDEKTSESVKDGETKDTKEEQE